MDIARSVRRGGETQTADQKSDDLFQHLITGIADVAKPVVLPWRTAGFLFLNGTGGRSCDFFSPLPSPIGDLSMTFVLLATSSVLAALLALGWAKELRLRRALQNLMNRLLTRWRHAHDETLNPSTPSPFADVARNDRRMR